MRVIMYVRAAVLANLGGNDAPPPARRPCCSGMPMRTKPPRSRQRFALKCPADMRHSAGAGGYGEERACRTASRQRLEKRQLEKNIARGCSISQEPGCPC